MGLLGRLFGGGDPAKDLDKARQALEHDPARAMALARKLVDSDVGDGARELIAQARVKLFERAIAMADEAEESEYFEDAAEWLDRALEQLPDEGQRSQIETRRQTLLDKAAAADEEPWQEVETEEEQEDQAPFETGAHVEALIGMMNETIADRYDEQDEAFRAALGSLLEGEVEAASEALDALAEAHPDNGVVHLERGRARLILGNVEGARDDFAIAWQDLGSTPLFDGRAESAPGLWADAQLSLGEAEPVLEKLDDIADPGDRRADLSVPFATALVATEHFEEAERYLRRARREMPGVHDLTHLHATVLVRRDDPQTAIMALESVVGPACAGGTCRPAAMHVPSLQLLVALHREHGKKPRSEELAVYLSQMSGDSVADTASLQPDRSATVI